MAEKSHNPNLNVNSSLTHLPHIEESITFDQTNLDEVTKLIKELEWHKAPGSDDISLYIIKKTQDKIAPILVTLFNSCLENGIFPEALKLARVIPLHKGDQNATLTIIDLYLSYLNSENFLKK